MILQYRSKTRGWWTAHASFDPPDPQAYIDGLRLQARIIDGPVVYGQFGALTHCPECGNVHDGHEGSCLI